MADCYAAYSTAPPQHDDDAGGVYPVRAPVSKDWATYFPAESRDPETRPIALIRRVLGSARWPSRKGLMDRERPPSGRWHARAHAKPPRCRLRHPRSGGRSQPRPGNADRHRCSAGRGVTARASATWAAEAVSARTAILCPATLEVNRTRTDRHRNPAAQGLWPRIRRAKPGSSPRPSAEGFRAALVRPSWFRARRKPHGVGSTCPSGFATVRQDPLLAARGKTPTRSVDKK